ncbi:hypothetical protein, partial [Klebsiella pneumoniae]|uniref:hypothetical protein n=1 Tax=Klebsiella pneumoniae TaxID=573 RepID=UPI001131F000
MSVEVGVGIFLSAFTCVYARAIFESITTWWQFSLTTLVHVMLHLCHYPVRLTAWYFDVSSYLQEHVLRRHCPSWLHWIADNSTPLQWHCRVCLDMNLRFVTLVVTSIAYLLFVPYLRY